MENGDLLLDDKLKGYVVDGSITKFRTKELEEATDNYAHHRILGRGVNGCVYKGLLADKRVVAIKRFSTGQEKLKKVMERIVILGQIKHRNMVKLLGCCLEETVPLLVYEFVSNGTLYDQIHNGTSGSRIFSWDNRIRIACESAGALDYLHTAAVIPIIHGNVKPTNILLDENYTPKIADIGTSDLIWSDYNTMYVFTMSHIVDPQYFQTYKLIDKSDVYSFGVLTRKRVIDWERREEDLNLVIYFPKAKRENRLHEILDSEVVKEATDEQLEAVCDLVCRCLEIQGEYRPSMKQVTMELETIRKLGKHP